MKKHTSSSTHPTHNNSGLFPIRTVSTITGVNPVTIRAWERRYGLIKPQRSDTGRRLYCQADIDLIQQILGLLRRGIAIGQVKKHLYNIDTKSTHNTAWQHYLQRMQNAVLTFDTQTLDATYNEALALYPIDMVTEQLITPLLRQLGSRWAANEGSVAEEHFFGAYLRNKLGARFHHEASRARGPKLVAACLPGELHEAGLLLACLSLMSHDYRIILLGANTPLHELQAPVMLGGAAGILLSGSMDPAASVWRDQLPQLVADCRVPVFVGGHCALRHHDAISEAGAIPLASENGDLGQAAARINTVIQQWGG